MRQTAFLLPALLCASHLLPAADPQLMNMVPPDAKVIAGVNVDQARSSPFGQFVLAALPADQGFQQFVSASGFDPRQDLHEILIAATGPDKTAAHLLLARGNFDVNRLLSLAPKAQKPVEQNYNGTRLFSGPEKGMAFAFPDNNTAMAGDVASVKAALDRRNQASTIDARLAARVQTLSTTLDAWAVSALPLPAMPPMPAGPNAKNVMSSELLSKIQQTSCGIKFGDQIQLIAEAITGDAKDATALGDVIRFLVMMVQSQAPKAAAPALALMQNLHIVTDGAAVRVDLAVAESQIEALVAAGHRQAPKPAL